MNTILRMLGKPQLHFTIMFILGIALRVWLIIERDVYTDEVLYFLTTISNSFKDILTTNHWIKDHGMLYLAVLKVLSQFTTNIQDVRFINLLFYSIAYIGVYLLTKNILHNNMSMYLILLIISFHRYFVFATSLISPYNATLTFSLISTLILINQILYKSNQTRQWRVGFIIFTVLAFYSDYSFLIYTPLILVFLFYALLENRILRRNLFIDNLIIFGLISPGLVHLVSNAPLIQRLFLEVTPFTNLSFIRVFDYLLKMIFFRFSSSLSWGIFIFFAVMSYLFISYKSSRINLHIKHLLLLTIVGMVLIFKLVTFTTIVGLNVIIERALWSVYLSMFILMCLFMHNVILIHKKCFSYCVFVIIIFTIFNQYVYVYSHQFNQRGDIAHSQIQYKLLLNELKNKEDAVYSLILVIDNKHKFEPLRYYLSEDYLNSSSIVNSDELKIFLNKIKLRTLFIKDIRIAEAILGSFSNHPKTVVLIFLNQDLHTLRELMNKNLPSIKETYILNPKPGRYKWHIIKYN